MGMTSHSGSKEEVIFFSFQTTKPRKKENSGKNLGKTKEKERAKNQAVTIRLVINLYLAQGKQECFRI